MSFEEILAEKSKEVDEIVRSFLPKQGEGKDIVIDAMNYAVNAGGKRLRPMLMLETYRMFHGDDTKKTIKAFMAAQEFIHTYSLIHDDLPAMDNDEYRRGKKTTHIEYGEANAILAGDALLNYAFEITSNCINYAEENSHRNLDAIRVLSKKSGIYGMIGGQSIDINCEGKELNEDEYINLYTLKTSALIESSMMVGAILSSATKEEVDRVEKIARKIGIAFQIQDDILDMVGDEKELGKQIGSDSKNNKVTYAAVVTIEKAKEEVKRLTDEAISLLDGIVFEHGFLKELLLSLVNRTK